MNKTNQKPSFFLRLAEWIVDKRNLLFLIYGAAILFSIVSQGWVSVNNDLTDYLPETTETKRGLVVMEDNFTTFASSRVMISNITYKQARSLAVELEQIEGITSVDMGAADDAGDQANHFRDSAVLYDITFDGEEADPVSVHAVRCKENIKYSRQKDILATIELKGLPPAIHRQQPLSAV